ncbi:carbon storage regulator CsrA [Geosporobacter ferrireducens]|uniref:Translational regulator CsrA n=1 Tax=Geosporobacter ferrireducens TaxID=1424294 RepID=A0A1D8GGH9_9FIRM|nr:carbon storage regulator CsrA [Geosporobacter ferrireducens]AOT70025.1 carbon storage regulator [Geosporobacter ferrireducens]MTI53429.1 carbon storage regulator CsrA [Geosporobacter ferrireducens]
MLILTRKKDESIMIDEQIEIKILSAEDGKVKLGIAAPKNISVLRKEIYMEIRQENQKAAAGQVNIEELKNLLKK